MNPKRVLLVAAVPFLQVLFVEPKMNFMMMVLAVLCLRPHIADETHENCENHTVHKFDGKSVPSSVATHMLYRWHKSFPYCCHELLDCEFMCCAEWTAGRLYRSLAMS